ncbi:unnamed protein product [Urochloa humidicola]
MELVDNEGEFIWENGDVDEEESEFRMEDEEDGMSAAGIKVHLPNEIIPDTQEYKTQYGMDKCSEDLEGSQMNIEEAGFEADEMGMQSKEGSEADRDEPEVKQGRRKTSKKWGPVVLERKSVRLMGDNRTAKEKAISIKKAKNLEHNYPAKGLVFYQDGDLEAVEMLRDLEANLQGPDGGGHQPLVRLLGGSSLDPLGGWRLKKFKVVADATRHE